MPVLPWLTAGASLLGNVLGGIGRKPKFTLPKEFRDLYLRALPLTEFGGAQARASQLLAPGFAEQQRGLRNRLAPLGMSGYSLGAETNLRNIQQQEEFGQALNLQNLGFGQALSALSGGQYQQQQPSFANIMGAGLSGGADVLGDYLAMQAYQDIIKQYMGGTGGGGRNKYLGEAPQNFFG